MALPSSCAKKHKKIFLRVPLMGVLLFSSVLLLLGVPMATAAGARTDTTLSVDRSGTIESLLSGTLAEAGPECARILAQLPANVKIGIIKVPEDWSKPTTSRLIPITYYTRASHKPDQTPHVVFFNGGPGGSAFSSIWAFENNSLARSLNWVFFDQRGTGCSQAYPEPVSMDDYFQQIDRYGPKSIVLDAEAIRYQLLGPEGKWRIFGQSFGASIVAYYLSMAPGSVEAAFMHGSSLTDDPKAWVKDRIKGQGRVLDQYFTRYPEDRQRLTQLKKSVSSSSCYGDSQAKICGPGIFDALYVRLGFKDAWEQLHQEITVLSQLKGPLLDIALQTQFFPKIRNEISIARYLIGNLVAGSDLRQTCQAAIQDLRTEGYDVQNQLINDCHLLSAIWTSWDKDLQKFANSQFLSVAQFKNDLELTLTSATLPVYIYSGELDSFSPKETFGPFVQALKGLVNYLHFLQSGHEGYYSEDQIIVDLYKPKTVKEKSQSAAFEP